MSLELKMFTFNGFQENTYVIYDKQTLETAIIDPGCHSSSEQAALKEFIEANQLKVKYLLNTHCHVDHVLGNWFVKDTYQVPLLIHPLEINTLHSVPAQATMYGFFNYERTEPDMWIEEGQQILLGTEALDVLFVPGHAPGHVAFYYPKNHICIAGDVLFRESIGRTDFPGCNHAHLIQSIKQKLFTLPDKTVIYPGHGPSTTIAHEKKYNPFL